MHRHQALTLTLWLACGCSAGVTLPDAAVPEGDPCVPGGHVHREPAGDWCHCDRGFRATTAQLGCEPDPNFTGATTVDFTGTAERACWHASNGPYRVVVEDGVLGFFFVGFCIVFAQFFEMFGNYFRFFDFRSFRSFGRYFNLLGHGFDVGP